MKTKLSKYQIASRTAALVISFLLLCFSAGLIDYMRVFHFEEKPVFCFSRQQSDKTSIHTGIGYSYTFTYEDENLKSIRFENIFGADEIIAFC